MELTPEQQVPNGALYMRFLITVILRTICASNKQVFLETVLRAKRIKAGKYIINERSYCFALRGLICIFT